MPYLDRFQEIPFPWKVHRVRKNMQDKKGRNVLQEIYPQTKPYFFDFSATTDAGKSTSQQRHRKEFIFTMAVTRCALNMYVGFRWNPAARRHFGAEFT